MTIRIPVFVANVTFFNLLILNYLIHLIDWDLFYQYNKFYELSPQVFKIENLYFLFIKKKKKNHAWEFYKNGIYWIPHFG